jgi:hypothetical protein
VKKLLFLALPVAVVLLLATALLAAGCGGSTTTTTSATVAPTTSSSQSTSSTATSESSTTSSSAAGLSTQITVNLTGQGEVPPTNSQATGVLTLSIQMGAGGGTTGTTAAGSTNSSAGGSSAGGPAITIAYKLEVTNITDATAAHIHLGAAGQNGPVIVPLFTGPQKSGSFTGVLAQGTITEKDLTGPMAGKSFTDLAGAVLAGQTYANVHTVANPNGEIRGQIVLSAGGAGSSTTTPAAGGAAAGTSTTGSAGSAGY